MIKKSKPKVFLVSAKDLFDKKKNPNFSLSSKDILNNKKIKKVVVRKCEKCKKNVDFTIKFEGKDKKNARVMS